MRATYTNRPVNRRVTRRDPALKTLLVMSVVLALMFGVKLICDPRGDLEELAVMLDASGEDVPAPDSLPAIDSTAAETEDSTVAEPLPPLAEAEPQSMTGSSQTAPTAEAARQSGTGSSKNDPVAEAAAGGTRVPLDGKLTSPFAPREDPFGSGGYEYHSGIDIAGGSCIYAWCGGEVTAVARSPGYGNYIIIRHSERVETLYAHCETLLVGEGDTVRAGDIIATPGETGRATGVHLHFELRVDGAPVNPAFLFT